MTAEIWECAECGLIEYGKYPPEECSKCWKVNSFVEVPEDIAEQMKDNVLEQLKERDLEDEEDLDDEEELL